MTELKRIPNQDENQFNTFYSVTSHLSQSQFQNFETEWKEIDLFGPIRVDNSKHLENIKENLDNFTSLVLDNFDFAITGIEIAILLVSGIQNLMYRVMNYIYDMIYNQLEMLLRSGVYTLTVIPDFQTTNGMSLPTTSLKAQAENVYKKFYDINDENVPYNYKTTIKEDEEKLLHTGLQIAERIRAKYEDATEVGSTKYKKSSGALEFNVFGEMDAPYFNRNFRDLNERLELLSKPYGQYEGLFLYFSFDIRQNLHAIGNLIKSFTGFTFLFQSKGLNLANRLESRKRRKITIITENKLNLVEVTTSHLIQKSGIGQTKNTYDHDEELSKVTLVPAAIGRNHDAVINSDNRAWIVRCISEEEETQNSSETLYYNYLDRIRSSNGTKEKTSSRPKYRYVLEIDMQNFEILDTELDAPSPSPFDMFYESQRVFFFSSETGEDEKIGEGYVMSSVPVNMNVEAKGNWHSINFSDLTGTTDWIREMQNIIASRKNTFAPSTLGLDELLASVKAIKQDIEDMIEMLEAVIEMLNIQINFDGAIWAKFVRHENYDEFASLLTNVSHSPTKTPYKKFKPSSNATIRYYLDQILEIGRQYPEYEFKEAEIREMIDEAFMSEDAEKIQSALDQTNWDYGTGEEANTIAAKVFTSDLTQGGLIMGPLIIEQLFELSKRTMIDSFEGLGSAANDLKITLDDISKEAQGVLTPEEIAIMQRKKDDPNFHEVYDVDLVETIMTGSMEFAESAWLTISNPIDSLSSAASSTWDVISSPIESSKVAYESVTSGVNSAITAVAETKEMRYSAAYFSAMKNKLKDHVLYDPEIHSDFHIKQKIRHNLMMIRAELVRVTPLLSVEFGFSQVLVTYLPKTGVFHPVAWLAKLLDLKDQDGGVPKFSAEPDNPEKENLNNVVQVVDRNQVEPYLNENSIPKSRESLKTTSEKRNSTTAPKQGNDQDYDFSPIVPLYTNEGLKSIDSEPCVRVNGKSFFIHQKSRIKTPNVYYGIRLQNGLKLETENNPTDGDETKFKYSFEFKFNVNVDSIEKTYRPRISRMEVYCGLVRQQNDATGEIFFENNNNRAFHVNSQNTHIFRLNQRSEKYFVGDCFITFGQLNNHKFYPYVMIRYNAGSLNRHYFGDNVTFQVDKFKLYRIKA